MPHLSTEDIYLAAFDEDNLERLPSLLANACNARSAMICWFHLDGSPEMSNYSHFSAEQMALYVETFTEHDVWAKIGFEPARLNGVTVADDLVPPAVFEKSFIYNEFFRRHNDDTFHCMGGASRSPWGLGLVGLHRGRPAGAFDEQALDTLVRIMPHVRAALAVRGQLAGQGRALRSAQQWLDVLATAVVVVRGSGKVVRLNAAAEAILRMSGVLRLKAGYLIAAEAAFEEAIVRATARRQPSATAVALGRKQPFLLMINVVPLGSGEAALLFRGTLRQSQGILGVLRSLFGMTPREAQITLDLAEGRSPIEVSEKHGISINTLKSQTKAILSKTECRRQAELAALVARLAQARTP